MAHNPDKIRSFIALELPEEVRSKLGEIEDKFKRGEHSFVKWVNPEGIHLTLKFLGNVYFKQVAEISKAIEEAAQGVSPFRLAISDLGAFPSLKQPRVLWVGVGGEVGEVSRLQQNIDAKLAPLGFAKEDRPFVPHLTLARIKEGTSPVARKSFGELVMSASFEISYPFVVESISLMRSQLTPQGAIYTCLSRVKLGVN